MPHRSDILDRVSDLIRPGITTKEVDQAAADFHERRRGKERVSRLSAGASRVFPGTFASLLTTKWSTVLAASGAFSMAT
jgi:hypothetical protein